jgi:hypothetical protein
MDDEPPELVLSLLDLPAPTRSLIHRFLVGELVTYVGHNEVNREAKDLLLLCKEVNAQIVSDCLTYFFDEASAIQSKVGLTVEPPEDSSMEMPPLRELQAKYRRMRYLSCLFKSVAALKGFAGDEQLPGAFPLLCDITITCPVNMDLVAGLFERYRIRRLQVCLSDQSTPDPHGMVTGPDNWREFTWSGRTPLQGGALQHLCIRGSATKDFLAWLSVNCPNIRKLTVIDHKGQDAPLITSTRLEVLSFIACSPADETANYVEKCPNLRYLSISRSKIAFIRICSPHLLFLSLPQCRQVTDECIAAIVCADGCPNLQYLDISDNRNIIYPVIVSTTLQTVKMMHCPGLVDMAVTQLCDACPKLIHVNFLQSSLELPTFASSSIQVMELTTCQKLMDTAVTQLLEQCHSLKYLDLGHCCQLSEPTLVHQNMETIMLTFCVNLKETAVQTLFQRCPSLRYVELAVCMFDMAYLKSICPPACQVVINFDF